jgi:nucleoside-diphosphate-sugar epimerase
MNNSVLIGATGFLGSYIAENKSVRICPLRFEDSQESWQDYADTVGPVDSVILLSRACRKQHPRRDKNTMLTEVSGVIKILQAFPNSHIVFLSTKVVYGLADDDVRPMTRNEITDYIDQSINNKHINTTVNLPNKAFVWKDLKKLSQEHQIYAQTKLMNERLIELCASTYTIFRVWDII